MVGLSILLESQKGISKKAPQVINKVNTTTLTIKPFTKSSSSSSSSSRSPSSVLEEIPDFLQRCFLCKQKLLPGKDIYIYKGDKGFCSVECRCRQIFMDEEETLKKDNCSFAANTTSSASASASASAIRSHHSRKPTRNGPNAFVY